MTGESDFFLDSKALRGLAAGFARKAAGAALGTSLGRKDVDLEMEGRDDNDVYFGAGEKGATARTALALYVTGATLSATALGDGEMELVWEGGIFYPPAYAFTATIPTLWGPVTVRLDETLFCGLQMDGWMHPYTQRWVARVAVDDERLAASQLARNDPGPFERAVHALVRVATGPGRR